MIRERIETSQPYTVLIGQGSLAELPKEIEGLFGMRRLFLIGDAHVMSLYGHEVHENLRKSGFQTDVLSFQPGEEHKTMPTLMSLLQRLADLKADRKSVLIALGGGVTGDLVGLAAALYQRGIPVVQVPTTLLAAVDSSVGGKTAVNLPQGKNLVGSFWQPALVVCDPSVFQTLSPELWLDGMGEVIKTFLLGDAVAFERLVAEDIKFPVEEMIQRCVQIKATIVLADEREEDGRRLLNLGHTVGHALEQVSGYSVHHGQAVAYGLFVIYRIAASLSVCSAELANKVEALLRKFGFPLHYEFSVEALTLAMVQDKKRQGENITVVLPEAVGSCRLHTLPLERFRDLVTEAIYKAGELL